MPHVVFASPLRLNEIAARFEPLQQSEGGVHVHLMDAYLGSEAVLIETHVGEPTITQHVGLMIIARPRPDSLDTNEYTIQLGTIGQPRPTAGIHQAVGLVAEWVLKLHPDNRIIKQKLKTTTGTGGRPNDEPDD